MSTQDPLAGVCIVRAERQGSGVLITLIVNANVERLSTPQTIRVTDVDAALAVVGDFLVGFTHSEPV